jgi:hypothetical protein
VVASSNRRYLQDRNGKPFRIHGDSGWDANVVLTLDEWRAYLEDRKAKGFNTVLMFLTDPYKYRRGSPAPAALGAGNALPFLKNSSGGTWDGDPTFRRFDADFSSPNPAYFAWIDTMLNEAASRGILIVLTTCYLGYNNGVADGWWQTLNNRVNTQAMSYSFGQYLGERYKSFGNIVWLAGGDMVPPSGSEGEARAHKILEGIKAAGDTHLWLGHWKHDYLSTDVAAFAADMDIQAVYTHGAYEHGQLGPTYGRSRLGYSHSPALPTILLETTYEGDHNATSAQIREFMWGAALSTIGGVIFGNTPLWTFDADWHSRLGSTGSRDMQQLGALLDSLPWHQLVPSGLAGMKTLVTQGTGSYTTMPHPGDSEVGGEDWVVAAATPDGRHLIAYLPNANTGSIAVDLTALSGLGRARWFDPTTGAYRAIGNIPNTGPQVFTRPGNNGAGAFDWVLVLDQP